MVITKIKTNHHVKTLILEGVHVGSKKSIPCKFKPGNIKRNLPCHWIHINAFSNNFIIIFDMSQAAELNLRILIQK